MATRLLVLTFASFGAGAIAAIVAPNGRLARQLALGAALLGSLSAAALAAVVLATNRTVTAQLPDLLQPLGGLRMAVDPLGAIFLAIVALAGAPASLFGFGYTRGLDGQTRGRVMHALFNLFLAGLCLVPAAGNVLTFLFGWELMALASYLLVVGHAAENGPSAGLWYAVMTHAGFLALLAAFATLAGGGATDFASLRAHAATLSPTQLTAVFVLIACAFGSKAGLVPLHVWLPRAHPAAPSHVSALMSAAMVKLGVYGALRFFFDLLPPGPAWWGGALLAAGVVTALTGVLYSVAETHLKRLLAYSTIENIGLMFVGVGFGLLMRGYGHADLAAAGVVVALLHGINHAAFKTLLFLGGGAVVHSTHATSLEAYGGLIKRMPATAAFMLIGAVALAAMPPLNGFPSEWLTFQLLVAGARHSASELAILLPLALAGVALVAGLAAVSAVRLFGITFLALPRTRESAAALDAPRSMRIAMAVPAVICVAFGLLPAQIVPRLSMVAGDLGLAVSPLSSNLALAVPLAGSRYSPILVATVLIVGAAAAVLLSMRRLTAGAVRVDAAWNCGRLVQSPRSEYTAASFAEPLNRVFAGFYRPRQQLRIEVHPLSRYFVQAIGYRGRLAPWMEQALYLPVIAGVRRLGRAVGRLQTGSIHWYLALLPAALVALLFLSRWIR
jgi:formate hydrogenlyase subunit 3/multisubunit Na+/H+ antiporter MnhD subunit